MCIYLRAPVQEVQEHKVHSPRANSQQFPLSSTVADVPAQARDNRGLYAKDTLEQAGVSSLVHALFFFFFFPRFAHNRTALTGPEKVFHVDI